MDKETSVPAAAAGRGLGWGLGVRLGLDSGSRESVELAIQRKKYKNLRGGDGASEQKRQVRAGLC